MAKSHRIELTLAGIKLHGGAKRRTPARTLLAGCALHGLIGRVDEIKKQYERTKKAETKRMVKYWRRHGGKYISKTGMVKLMKADRLKKLPRGKQIKRYAVKAIKKIR